MLALITFKLGSNYTLKYHLGRRNGEKVFLLVINFIFPRVQGRPSSNLYTSIKEDANILDGSRGIRSQALLKSQVYRPSSRA